MEKNIPQYKFFFEIRFIFLRSSIIKKLKKIFSKYEISVQNISYYNYVFSFKSANLSNIFELADKLNNGLNLKEILLVKKPPKNKGFFERFFNFFS